MPEQKYEPDEPVYVFKQITNADVQEGLPGGNPIDVETTGTVIVDNDNLVVQVSFTTLGLDNVSVPRTHIRPDW